MGQTKSVGRQLFPMHLSPRCGARTRKGTPCLAPAVTGKRRCRMHGGAEGSGAPKGNKTALKSGLYTREAFEERRRLRNLRRRLGANFYEAIRLALTVYKQRGDIDPAVAPREVLMAHPTLTRSTLMPTWRRGPTSPRGPGLSCSWSRVLRSALRVGSSTSV